MQIQLIDLMNNNTNLRTHIPASAIAAQRKMILPYKTRFTIEARLRESDKIRQAYPDRTPIICESAAITDSTWTTVASVALRMSGGDAVIKVKYVVPNGMIVAEFISVLRKKMKMAPEMAICLYARAPNGSTVLITGMQAMSELYNIYADPDGMLYLIYGAENTFGH